MHYISDVVGFSASLALLGAYHAYLRYRLRKNPGYTVQRLNDVVRTAWVKEIMQRREGVLAVQTLRNSMMAAVFLASTSVLMIIGVLTLSEQGDKLRTTWQALDVFGTASARLWLIKMLLLLVDLLVAFFSFATAIRLFHHVGYMINAPQGEFLTGADPAHVSTHLNRAGGFYSIGMRAYYYTVPLLLWLFGPAFMLAGTVALVSALYYLDRSPRVSLSKS
ncbi:MAG: DUF599 domain-containing protein [Betaproteobacteria bacterium]|nr:MAG: DUF599 domain-containing protein [Betaproteobacteria bacterium]